MSLFYPTNSPKPTQLYQSKMYIQYVSGNDRLGKTERFFYVATLHVFRLNFLFLPCHSAVLWLGLRSKHTLDQG